MQMLNDSLQPNDESQSFEGCSSACQQADFVVASHRFFFQAVPKDHISIRSLHSGMSSAINYIVI